MEEATEHPRGEEEPQHGLCYKEGEIMVKGDLPTCQVQNVVIYIAPENDICKFIEDIHLVWGEKSHMPRIYGLSTHVDPRSWEFAVETLE